MKQITRTDATLALMQIFDRLDAAERKAALRPKADDQRPEVEADGRSDAEKAIDSVALETGRKSILEGALYRWNEVRASRDEESGTVNVTSYEKWLKSKAQDIPDYVSRDAFVTYFSDDLLALYESEKAEAIARLEEEE